jgi:hypothetical protein
MAVYTDGSQITKDETLITGAGEAIYSEGQLITTHSFPVGHRAKVFDAGMAALAAAVPP